MDDTFLPITRAEVREIQDVFSAREAALVLGVPPGVLAATAGSTASSHGSAEAAAALRLEQRRRSPLIHGAFTCPSPPRLSLISPP